MKFKLEKRDKMIWEIKDEQHSLVVGNSDWTPLDDYKEIEARSGVYILADDKKNVKYIGKAGARRLVMEHLQTYEIYSAIFRGKSNGATIIKALYTHSNDNSKTLEKHLIGKYNPENNIYLVTED